MRFALYAAAVVLLGAACGLAYLGARPTPTPPPAPAVTVEPAVHDFGPVSRDRVVTAAFRVTNTHPVAVTVGQVIKGCSCSEAEVTPRTIEPGGSAELKVTWELRGKRGRSMEVVSVPYSGPGGVGGFQTVRVVAGVFGVVDPDADELDLTGGKRTAEVGFASAVGREFTLTGATANHPSLRATVLPGRRVRVEFDPAVGGWESGRLQVLVTTDQRDEPDVAVGVRAGQ